MKKSKALTNLNLLLPGLIVSGLLVACNGGNNTGGNTIMNSNPLAEYKSMLTYTPANQQQIKATGNNQQSFTVTGDTTFSSIDIRFFSNNSCDGDNGGLYETITLNNGIAHRVSFPAGTYTSSAASNYALCGKYSNGCAGLYAAFDSDTVQSMRFDYNYSGGGTIRGGCMAGSADSSYREAVLNWSGSAPWAACTDNNCGFSQSYNDNLPANYTAVPAITVTPIADWQTMMGSSYAFTATITGGSSTVTPTVANLTGNTVSPASCSLNSSVAGSESCVFIITNYTGSGNYSYWNPEGVANSTNVNRPSSISINIINLTIAATNSATVNGSASPLAINEIIGMVVAPYVYLPQTGQTPAAPLNVESMIGADGNVHAGIPWAYVTTGSTAPSPRFSDNGCEITDNLTGLIWVKDLNTVNGGNTLDWQNALTTANAGTWCDQAAGTWRVPNINELASLVNYAESDVANWLNETIDSDGGGFTNVIDGGYYWSSSSSATSPGAAWGVSMSAGFITPWNENSNSFARLFPVRGEQ